MDFILNSKYNSEKSIWEISIKGEVDIYNSAELKKSITDLLEEKQSDVYIDCSALEYIDSTGLGTLVGILKRVKQYDGEVCLLNVKPSVAKIFNITNLNKVFKIKGGSNE